MISPRLSQRMVRHHLPIGLVTLASAFVLYITRSYPDVITRLSFASAYPALILLTATLIIGPMKMLAGDRLAISFDIRRDVGIWAGIAGIFHAIIGQCVHLRGRPWLYYIYENWQQKHFLPVRHDLFGLANYTGLVAALVLLALLATSNDVMLRKLSTPGWKQLQRWNYVCFALTAVHTLTYQTGIETPKLSLVGTAVTTIIITLWLQLVGYNRRRDTVKKSKLDGSAESYAIMARDS
jgi:sulfoxide reductase heme-binding subunit YedZ